MKVAERNPELQIEDLIEAVEPRRSDADYGVEMTGVRDGLANDERIAGETLLPDPVTEDEDGRMIFVGRKASPGGHAELRYVEVIFCGALSPQRRSGSPEVAMEAGTSS